LLRFVPLFALTMLLAGCGGTSRPETTAAPPPAWQTIIRDADRKRLAGLWAAWTRSLGEAEGMRASVAALGTTTVADAARPAPPPPPGDYRCRSVKLGTRIDGATRPATPPMTTDGFAACSITERAGLLWFEKRGAQRIAGTLYPDGDRQVFLGTMALAGEPGMMAYGTDRDRDQVGVLRNVGERRWRLELPWPMWQANLEIIEIVAG